MTKKLLAASTLAFLLSTGAAFAQTTGASYGTGTTGTTGAAGSAGRTGSTSTSGKMGATGTSSSVGVPNTGAGGNAGENVAILGMSAVVALGAGALLLRRGLA